ncbi:hypothetical protein ACFFTN_06930 [Aminobacter aganoensis]|uniref:Uncharacterized protein n=1 Tax=Aminobacter aganoensis TaxID=83264 RepID=A0A7X0FCR9_9HYPH|nr:hypothetical protein [Aminobacter aganoensis]MBB6357325.1 hypothetical protein [Aminobacter aganoensis]
MPSDTNEAERLLAGTGWLPEPLRMFDNAMSDHVQPASLDEGDVDLPAFLVEQGEDTEATGPEDGLSAELIAAE